jgi:hypothetical protein
MDVQHGHVCVPAAVIDPTAINRSFCIKSVKWIQVVSHV